MFAVDGRTGFEIKPVAFVKDFCVLENLDVAVQSFAFDYYTVFLEGIENVRDACCRTKIVDEVCLHFLKYREVSDFYAALDVLFKNLRDDTDYVCLAIFC